MSNSGPPNMNRGDQRTVPLAEAIATGMSCLGDLRDAKSRLFTKEQALEAVADLVRMLPDMPAGLKKQYGLSVSPGALDELESLSRELEAWDGNDLPDAISDRARACMRALLGGKSF